MTAQGEPKNLSDRVLTLEQRMSALMESVDSLALTVNQVLKQVSDNAKPNWPMLIALGGMGMTLLGAAWQLVSLQTQVALSPIMQQNTTSIADRRDLNERVTETRAVLSKIQSELTAEVAERRAYIVEFESQFKNKDNVGNMRQAQQEKINNLLWEKTFGTHYPSEVQYYPSVHRELDNK